MDLTAFEEFWRAFPNRIGKLHAKKAYEKARKSVSQQELLDGVDRYISMKPSWQDYCHPATWLNQGRWMDEAVEERRTTYIPWVCRHTPECKHRAACEIVSLRKVTAGDRRRDH